MCLIRSDGSAGRAMIPLITSIPPRFNRQAGDDREIGREYALNCIRSWRNCGFDPVSVNAVSEPVSELITSEAIKLLTVERDASDRFGKPLVYLADVVAAACSQTDGPLAITNADILIDMTDSTRQAISGLKPGQCLISRRRDIEQVDSRNGVDYRFGYDFFAFHARDLSTFSNDDFVFGMPWWDHYFPISMYMRGIRSLPAINPFVYHLAHTERWEPDNWVALGKRFLELIQEGTLGDGKHDALVRNYAHRFRHSVVGKDARLVSRLKAGLRKLINAAEPEVNNGAESELRVLFRLAELNVKWLDERGPRYT